MADQDPYSSIAKPLTSDDPYAKIATRQDASSLENVPGALPGMQTPQQAAGIKKPQLHGASIDYGKVLAAGDIATGAAKGALHTLSSPDEFMRQHGPAFMTNQNFGFGKPANLQHVHEMATPQGAAQKIGNIVEQSGEFMLPGGAEEKLGAKLGELAPKAAPLIKAGVSGLSSGIVNKAQGGEFGTGALAGAGGSLAGQGIKALAPPLAEAALKVRGNQRLFGRTVGEAILNDTGKAIRPESIARNANATISRLEPEINAADQASAASGLRGSLAPARSGVDTQIGRHTANRAMKTAGEIQPVADFLKTDQLTNLPLAQQQAAPGLRSLKRGLAADFIGPWSPEESIERKAAARGAYGNINRELHDISPETKSMDQRISSLIPVASQGKRVAAEAPFLQRAVDRIARPTGGLAPAITGGYIGSREGGVKGGIAGGLAGLVAPELMASPEGRMLVARSLYKAGALRPLTGSLLQFDRNRGPEK
jgi:hypothetical protein